MDISNKIGGAIITLSLIGLLGLIVLHPDWFTTLLNHATTIITTVIGGR